MSKIREEELKKLYYSIGEVAQMFDVNTSLIRFWEKEFPALKPKKNKKGNRLFTPKDIVKIDKIYTLVKVKGFTLDGANKALKDKTTDYNLEELESFDKSELIQRLKSIKHKLLRYRS